MSYSKTTRIIKLITQFCCSGTLFHAAEKWSLEFLIKKRAKEMVDSNKSALSPFGEKKNGV
jgi:hypothetical protein